MAALDHPFLRKMYAIVSRTRRPSLAIDDIDGNTRRQRLAGWSRGLCAPDLSAAGPFDTVAETA